MRAEPESHALDRYHPGPDGRSGQRSGEPSSGDGNEHHELAEKAKPKQQLLSCRPVRSRAAASGIQGVSRRPDDARPAHDVRRGNACTRGGFKKAAGYGYGNAAEGYSDGRAKFGNNSLQVGVNLSTSVNLMELKHSIKGADAQLKLADNEINLFKKDLYFEVQRAFNNLDFAEDDVPYAQNTAIQALENINTVEKMYESGVLNYVALQDARKDYITAMQNYITSLTFYNKSLIQVEEAMHYHIVDIHHKSQHAMMKHSDELIEHLNEALGCDEKEVKKKKRKKDNL